MADFQKPVYDAIRERDKDFYDRLAAAGFRLDFGDDDSGLFMKYLRRGSGYYIDVGASDLIADGSIKLRQGQVERLTRIRWCWTTAPNCRPTWSSMPPGSAR